MADHNIIVIGASAGGVETLTRLVKLFPANLPAAVFVVMHISPAFPSFLPRILSRAGELPALHPADGEAIRPGRVYVALPDFHLRLEQGEIRITHGPQENGNRPSVDVLFRSAAAAYGPRVIGVVLSGMLSDGALGLRYIDRAGGVTMVQEPSEALYSGDAGKCSAAGQN